jgi:hypothetical protein
LVLKATLLCYNKLLEGEKSDTGSFSAGRQSQNLTLNDLEEIGLQKQHPTLDTYLVFNSK